MSTYNSEMNFVNRKILTTNVKWEARPALEQIISPTFANPDEAKNIIQQLKDALGKRAIAEFPRMIFTANSKLQGGTRIIVNIKLLRELFGNEIDGDSGGGGKSYNPLSTQPRPPGRGV